MFCLVEYGFKNATTYEKRKVESRRIVATSLTEMGIRTWYKADYEYHFGGSRWREGEDWFSYRNMWITEVRIEQY